MKKLTKRQNEILGYMAQGMSNKEIVEKLQISRYTLTNHIAKLYDNLGIEGVGNKAEGSMRVKAVLFYLNNKKNS